MPAGCHIQLDKVAQKTVLDNLIHRLDVAEVVVAFTNPGDRLVEYANSAAHARFVTTELVPHLEAELPLLGTPAGRCLMGSSFGAVASLSTAYRYPDTYGALLLQSGSFLFTQLMAFLPRRAFDSCVRQYRGNYRTRRFSCFDQWLCMAFAQLTYRTSLRDIETCLNALKPKLYHAGFRGTIARNLVRVHSGRPSWEGTGVA